MTEKKSGKSKKGELDAGKLERLLDSLQKIVKGRNDIRPEAEFEDPLMQKVVEQISELAGQLESKVDEFNRMSINLNLGLAECIKALEEVRRGKLHVRVGEVVLESENEVISILGKTLNDTLVEVQEQMETIRHQQVVIQELSTPILQVWDNVLVLPVIGVVDTRRSLDIMERLLTEIVEKQSEYVILDITGVELVDTMTADHFIKLIKAAELLGATCIVSGIRPAVAQTLADIGVDLATVTTMRNLQAGLRECLRRMGEQPS